MIDTILWDLLLFGKKKRVERYNDMSIISEEGDSAFNATRNNTSLFTNGSAGKLLEGDKMRDILNIWRGDRSQGICFCREVEGITPREGILWYWLVFVTQLFL